MERCLKTFALERLQMIVQVSGDRLLDEDDWEVKTCALECLAALGRALDCDFCTEAVWLRDWTGSSVRIVGEHYSHILNVCDMIEFSRVLWGVVGARWMSNPFAFFSYRSFLLFCQVPEHVIILRRSSGQPFRSLEYILFWYVLISFASLTSRWFFDSQFRTDRPYFECPRYATVEGFLQGLCPLCQIEMRIWDAFGNFIISRQTTDLTMFLVLQDRRSSMRESCSGDSLLSVAVWLDFACVHRTRVTFMWILHINLWGNFACAYCGYRSCNWVPSHMHLRESKEFLSKLMALYFLSDGFLLQKFHRVQAAEGLRKGFLRGSSQKHYK